jgi:hypothetical protein
MVIHLQSFRFLKKTRTIKGHREEITQMYEGERTAVYHDAPSSWSPCKSGGGQPSAGARLVGSGTLGPLRIYYASDDLCKAAEAPFLCLTRLTHSCAPVAFWGTFFHEWAPFATRKPLNPRQSWGC